MKFSLILIFFCLILNDLSLAQTCCTGGVPNLTAFRIPQIDAKQIGLNLNYVYNRNGTLLLEKEKIESASNYRNVNSIMIQGDYGLSNRFSVSLLLPFLFQNEQIEFSNVQQSYKNSGIGDISVWNTYKVVISRVNWYSSLGVKLPTGSTNKTDGELGLPLPFSFQNGSGSVDFGIISLAQYTLSQNRLNKLIGMVAARINTKGNGFEAHPEYKFGNSVQLNALYSRDFILFSGLANLNIGTNYQFRSKDVFQGGFQNPNTGGHWINMILGAEWNFTPKSGISFTSFLPVYRNISGLQLSTSWMFNFGLSYVFN